MQQKKSGCIVSIIRLWALYRLDRAIRGGDPSKGNTLPALWSAVEIHVCIICACLPSLSPVLTLVLRTIGLHVSTRRGSGKSPSPMPSLSGSSGNRRWPGQHQRRKGAYPGRRLSGGIFSTWGTGRAGSETGLRGVGDEEKGLELKEGVGVRTTTTREREVRVESRARLRDGEEDGGELRVVRTGSTPSEGGRSDEIPITYIGR